METELNPKNILEILEVLPHRFPMLLVDRVLDVVPGKTCKGLKNVSINEGFFQGHYPGRPIMPGVLILEAIAQVGAVMLLAMDEYRGKVPLIGAFDNVKFRRPVVPGDQLIIDVELHWVRGSIGKCSGVARVEGEVAAQMEMIFKLSDKE